MQETRMNRAPLYLAAFLLPAALMLAVFAFYGMYPFGDLSLLVIDMNSEYVDYFAQLGETVRTGGSLQRTWNMGMGLNMLGLIAFYASSICNIILLIVPVKYITEAIFLITVLKAGFCGLFFAMFLTGAMKMRPLLTLAFSCAYAMMAYNIAYSSNLMWLDGVAVLPLVMLGIERIHGQGRYGLFIGSLVYTFYSSYYIGYMIGVFSFLYFTARYFSTENAVKIYAVRLLRFIGAAVVAAGCCAFILLPAFLNLKNGQTGMWDIPVSFSLRLSFVDMLSKLLPGAYDSLTDAGLPNIYCTVFGFLLLALYFFNKALPARERLIFGGMLGLLFLSFSCEILDLGWHAFEDPTWFPARYSFVFSFLVLYLGARCACSLEGISIRQAIGGAAILLFVFVETGISRYRHINMEILITGCCLTLFYTGVVLCLRYRPRMAGTVCVLALLFVAGEAFYNAYHMVSGIDRQFQYKTRESYQGYRDTYAPALALLPAGAERVEITEQRSANGGMALGYNSISHYSTTTYQPLNSFLRQLAYNTGTINEIRFAPSTPLSNGLLGIRHILSKSDMGAGYNLSQTVGEVGIYENELAFPLAWFADDMALCAADSGRNPFLLQNIWTSGLWKGENAATAPYTPLEILSEEHYNVEKIEGTGYTEYLRLSGSKPAMVRWTLENPEEREVYAYFPASQSKFSRVQAFVGEESVARVLAYRSNSIIPLGHEKEIRLSLVMDASAMRFATAHFYSLDMDAAKQAARTANSFAMSVDTFTDTKISGNAVAPRDGVLFTTIPADSGWRILVDGDQVKPVTAMGVFLSVPLEKGGHRIDMHYTAPGLIIGFILSAASFLGLALWYTRQRLFRGK